MQMTFDNGTSTGTSTQAEITESLIRLLAQIALSLGIVGAYLVMLVQGKVDTANILQPIVLAVIAFWLGQSVTSAWSGVKHAQIKSTERMTSAQAQAQSGQAKP